MDFELLSESPQKPVSLLQLFERLLTNRRRQWQIWGEKPPYILALVVLLTVSLELTLGRRLIINIGGGEGLLQHLYGIVLFFLIFESLFMYTASKVASTVGKEGGFLAGMTYLNLSLTPFLVLLPLTILTWAIGDDMAATLRFILILVLFFKVMALWKQSIEHVYKFTSIQSAIVIYVSLALVVLVASFFVYISFFRAISKIITT
jgi:hypothetical protein